MAIPNSNQPAKNTKTEETKYDDAFEKRVVKAIQETKDEVSTAENKAKETEKLKIETLWRLGNRLSGLCNDLPEAEKKKLIMRFHAETGNKPSMFYLSMQFVGTFTEEEYKKAVEHGLTVRVMKALVSIRDAKLRKKMLDKVVEEGLNEDDIRELMGRKGTRGGSTTKRKADDSKKSPLRVFNKALDRVKMLNETLGSASEAANRLGTCKTEDERKDSLAQLVELRDQLAALDQSQKSFLKLTAGIVKGGK